MRLPLADEEFSSAAQGAAAGLAISFALVVVWLFLGLRSWRLIVPVVATLLLGLLATTGFAALAVGTLNLISVGFAILFVGIAVDFSIQFSVRFREMLRADAPSMALVATGRRVGRQILVAGCAAAAGFLAFVPTEFRGVAELGLIAGAGMLIALVCTLTFLPAMLSLCGLGTNAGETGIAALAPLDAAIRRARAPLLTLFAALFHRGRGPAARAEIRQQHPAHQAAGYRGDADADAPVRQPGDEPVHHRHRAAERAGRGRTVGTGFPS